VKNAPVRRDSGIFKSERMVAKHERVNEPERAGTVWCLVFLRGGRERCRMELGGILAVLGLPIAFNRVVAVPQKGRVEVPCSRSSGFTGK
jgi:hypothetical protein